MSGGRLDRRGCRAHGPEAATATTASPTSYVWIVLSVLAILLLFEVPSLRRVFRLDLAAATKVMA